MVQYYILKMTSPENKIHFLGQEFSSEKVKKGGIILAIGGVLARFEPSLAVPAIIVGTGMIIASHK